MSLHTFSTVVGRDWCKNSFSWADWQQDVSFSTSKVATFSKNVRDDTFQKTYMADNNEKYRSYDERYCNLDEFRTGICYNRLEWPFRGRSADGKQRENNLNTCFLRRNFTPHQNPLHHPKWNQSTGGWLFLHPPKFRGPEENRSYILDSSKYIPQFIGLFSYKFDDSSLETPKGVSKRNLHPASAFFPLLQNTRVVFFIFLFLTSYYSCWFFLNKSQHIFAHT